MTERFRLMMAFLNGRTGMSTRATVQIFACLAVVVLLAACGPGAEPLPTADAWTGTVSTAGNVTTVVNEAGSVWNGDAALEEEASIGVETGDEPYLLGDVVGFGATEERVYVLDAQVFRVRAYDSSGRHLFDFGSEGDGPGEFRGPVGMAVGAERVFVGDRRHGRITVYSLDGDLLDTWPAERLSTRGPPMVVGEEDVLYLSTRGGMAPWGPEGAAGPEIPFPMPGERPPTLTVRVTDAIPGYSPGAMIGRPVPFWPLAVAAMANDTSVIHGTAEQYRFSIQRPDGLALEVTRLVEPIVVGEEEAAWHAARVRAHLSQADAAWEWDAPPVPEHKPAYTAFLPTTSGETWVLRQGPGYRATNCAVDIPAWDAPESCWESEQIVDAFAPDGRYLGAVRVPENLLFDPRPVIDGDTVVGVVRNDAGTLRVKRYRVSIPDREQ